VTEESIGDERVGCALGVLVYKRRRDEYKGAGREPVPAHVRGFIDFADDVDEWWTHPQDL
jgi:hypothetical protein